MEKVVKGPAREPLASSAAPGLRGRVRSAGGEPVPRAHVRWIGLQKQDKEENPNWPIPDWGLPIRESQEVTTDEQGRFTFEGELVGGIPFGSVLVAVHPGHSPGGIDLLPDKTQWPSRVEIVLEPASAIQVEVQGIDGKPQPGATIHHLGRVPGSGAPLFERFVGEEAQVGANGRAELASFRGEQALWAEWGELRSGTWQGLQPSKPVVLRLGETFTIDGKIAYPDRPEWKPDYEGERRILVSGLEGILWKPLVRLRDVQEGTWGPEAVPLDGYRRFRVRLEGAPITPVEEEFEPPAAHARKHFDFAAEKNAELYLFVEDESQKPITNARAMVTWGSAAQYAGARHAEGASRPDGYLYIGTFPPGWVRYHVTAPGFAFGDGECEVPSPEAMLVTLKRGGGVSGHCSHAGGPVSDFDLIYWQAGGPRLYRHQSFQDREDGAFELENLVPGEWWIHAASADYPAGKPLMVEVQAERNATVELELPTGIRGGGRIVGADTGAPVSGARVQPYSSGGMERSFPWGVAASTSVDGRFELDAFVPGANFITVEAEGYGATDAKASATSTGSIDWGDIRLYRPQALQVSLIGFERLQGIGPQDLRASTIAGHELPEKRFDAKGKVRYEAVPPGDYRFLVSYPDSSWTRLQLRLDPGQEWSYDLKVSGERRLDVHVLDSRGAPLAFIPMVLLAGQEDTGLFVLRGRSADENGFASFEGIRAARGQLMILDQGNQTIATRSVALDGAQQSIELRVGDKPLRIHVVDKQGAPVAGAWVRIRSQNGADVQAVDDTDSSGVAELFGVQKTRVWMDVKHGIAGTCMGVPIDGSADEIEFALDARGSIELRVLDVDVPLAGVAVCMETTGGVTLSESQQTDDHGRVRFEPLGEGNYRFSFRRADAWPAVLERSLAAEDHAIVDVQMRRLGDLELSVLDSKGIPVSELELALHSAEMDADVSEWLNAGRVRSTTGLTTNRSGRIRLDGLPHGSYSWSFGEGQGAGTFDVAPAQRNEISVHLME